MNETIATGTRRAPGDRALTAAATLWFVAAAVGQLLFALYVTLFYGGAAARGEAGAWEDVLPHGLVPGDGAGNFALASHLFLAVLITVAGVMQLTPALRNRFPAAHRWTGRTYIISVLLVSVGGLWLIWTRGPRPLETSIAISINAALIWAFALNAWRHAAARRIALHRRWALRLFLASSGVWFFRVGLMFWILVNGGRPVGLGENLDGWFAVGLSFGQYVFPLIVLELYMRARDGRSQVLKGSVAVLLVALTLAMAAGTGTAFVGMWLPHM